MRRKAISLPGFEQAFAADPDPWNTRTSRYEAVKRQVLACAVGPGRHGRGLELAAGNGSNTQMLACRTLRLTATEGTAAGTALVQDAAKALPHVEVVQQDLCDRLPGQVYDLIVISEVLYYLPPRTFATLAGETKRVLRPGGQLVLAHHRDNFADRARPAASVHADFLRLTASSWTCRFHHRARRWQIARWVRGR